jgi:hypothetical protein
MNAYKVFSLRTILANALAVALAVTITGAAFARNSSSRMASVVASRQQTLPSDNTRSLPNLQGIVGGDQAGCVGAVIGFSLVLLAGAVAIAATAGADTPAVALAVGGAYAPLAAALC